MIRYLLWTLAAIAAAAVLASLTLTAVGVLVGRSLRTPG